ncbi:MAG TPA: ATP-binding protein [Planctomycetota bacterium]|nr:ATP-binding protein [Planctomycetota bacterium]
MSDPEPATIVLAGTAEGTAAGLLAGHGGQVVSAATDADAVRAARATGAAAVVIDLASTAGIDTGRAIRDARPDLPIVFLSRLDPDHDLVGRAYALAPVDVLFAPIRSAALQGAVARACELRRLRALAAAPGDAAHAQGVAAALAEGVAHTRAIVDAALDAVITIDEGDVITDWNPQAEAIFGWSKAEAIGRHLVDLIIPHAYRAAHRRGIDTYLATGVGPVLNRRIELTALRRDGGEFPVELSIVPTRIAGRLMFCGFLRDITHERAARRLAAEKAEALERTNAELAQFAYVSSHDLQEPLRMIRQYLGLLDRRIGPQLDESSRQFIGYALDGATRMQALITDLLSFSRLDRETVHDEVDLERVVLESVANLKARIDESGASVRHEPLPRVLGDKIQLVQVLQNLIGNGLKFRRPDVAPEILVSAADRGDGWWVVSVRDNGIGIAPEHQQRIFDVFQRLHARAEYEGTGIGLAICKKIVEHHGGTLTVESTLGAGATFSFALEAVEPRS